MAYCRLVNELCVRVKIGISYCGGQQPIQSARHVATFAGRLPDQAASRLPRHARFLHSISVKVKRQRKMRIKRITSGRIDDCL